MNYKDNVKRLFDIVISICAMPFVLALTLLLALPVYLDDRGPLLFRSRRRGRHGVPFTIYKFRSMTEGAPDIRNIDGSTLTAADDPRVTRVGKILRKTSLDEVPQIVNVLKGDMSIVGPRPDMAGRPLSKLSQEELKRLTVRPGITGYSQAYYRNDISAAQRTKLDCKYVDNVTIWKDAKILLKTVSSVLLAKGINSKPENLKHLSKVSSPNVK